ncbi:MAG: site-specific integrase [Candidatus Micrarchaeota archaeon]|nr:site-specific integrase [Candidatus Micrarchaeota archaeon]
MTIDPAVIKEIERTKGDIELLLPKLGKHKIEELQRLISRHYAKRFKGRRKSNKYGSLSKSFNDMEIQAFFRVIEDRKYVLLFKYQAFLGLRIGEVVKVNLRDIKLETRELYVKTEKAQVMDSLIIPLPLFNETLEYAKERQKEIEDAQGYLFYADKAKTTSQEHHLNQHYVRGRFRDFVIKAGLDEVYDVSDESQGRSFRRLHRLTTHSLRHYAITKFAQQCGGNVYLTSKFARHSDPSITSVYVNVSKQELYQQMDKMGDLQAIVQLKRKIK